MFEFKAKDLKLVGKAIDDAVARYISTIGPRVYKALDLCFHNMLGINIDKWGQVTISHNDKSAIHLLIEKKSAKIVETIIDGEVDNFIEELRKNSQGLRTSLAKKFKEQYTYRYDRLIRDRADKLAEEHVKQMFDPLEKVLDVTSIPGVFPANIELENPKSFDDTKVGKLLLREIARTIAERDKGQGVKGIKVVDRQVNGQRILITIEVD
jgi:hypothetical protein